MKTFLIGIFVASTVFVAADEPEAWTEWAESRPEAVWVLQSLEGTVLEVRDFENPSIEKPTEPLVWIRLKLKRDSEPLEADAAIREAVVANRGEQLSALQSLLFDADHGYPDTKKEQSPPGDGEVLLLFPAEFEKQIEVGDRLCVGAYELHPSSSPFGRGVPLQERGPQCDFRTLLIDKTHNANRK